MIMRNIRQLLALSFFLLVAFAPFHATAAQVRPLEVVTGRLMILEVERLANEHMISAALVRRALDRLNKGMNIMSQERAEASLKLLADVRDSVNVAQRSADALGMYINSNRILLKKEGHERYLPLTGLHRQVEKPFHDSLDRFLATAADFVQYCSENHDGISTGQEVENKRYDALYAAYLRDMENFNSQSMTRSQLLAEWASEYPSIMELLPR